MVSIVKVYDSMYCLHLCPVEALLESLLYSKQRLTPKHTFHPSLHSVVIGHRHTLLCRPTKELLLCLFGLNPSPSRSAFGIPVFLKFGFYSAEFLHPNYPTLTTPCGMGGSVEEERRGCVHVVCVGEGRRGGLFTSL